MKKIINFTIIAHIDAGKSTLADLLIGLKHNKYPVLDSMELEQERGITIKSQTCRIEKNGIIFNLIDSPGHDELQYEVIRSLSACENSLLIIDGTKGIQAQTLSHLKKAQELNHYILPIINKIDLPFVDIVAQEKEIRNLGFTGPILKVSAKNNIGIEEIFTILEKEGKPPQIFDSSPLALIIDSWYDNYSGMVLLVRNFGSTIQNNVNYQTDKLKKINIKKMGYFIPEKLYTQEIESGSIGFLQIGVKNIESIKSGDVLYVNENKLPIKIPIQKPLVFSNFFIEDNVEELEKALGKYKLNDPAFDFKGEKSPIYGIIFNCSFLGLLHLEIVRERLLREYNLDVITTVPNVAYKINGELIYDPYYWPEFPETIEEPEALCTFVFNKMEYFGNIYQLCFDRRGRDVEIEGNILKVILPLNEIITNFYDEIKSLSQGFVSFEYEILSYRSSKLSRLIILINDEQIREFSFVIHESKSKEKALKIAEKLKEIIPRGQLKIKIQVAENSPKNIIAREDINPYRKDVIAKCYGGDQSRKKKLLEKQKKGKDKLYSQSRKYEINPKDMTKLLKI